MLTICSVRRWGKGEERKEGTCKDVVLNIGHSSSASLIYEDGFTEINKIHRYSEDLLD